VFDFTPADLDELGWDEYVARGWESVFAGYQSNATIRTIARRWRDLLQGALDCPQFVADELVRDQVIMREDRDLMVIRDPEELLAAMCQVLTDMGSDLAELDGVRPAERAGLLAAYARLREYVGELVGDDEEAAGR
jgi:hypothetical protein